MVQTEVHEVTREYMQDVVPPGLWLQLVIDSIAFDSSGLLIMCPEDLDCGYDIQKKCFCSCCLKHGKHCKATTVKPLYCGHLGELVKCPV